MGVVVLALLVSCPGANGGQVELGTVSGLSPTDGTSTTDTTPTFSWDAVPGAVEYEWRIADSPSGLDSAASVSVTGTSHTPTTALSNLQTYYWQVRAKNGTDQYGDWSAAASIQIVAYFVGDTGPAGGIVFYDKGSYSDGWRYLEAAPSDQGEVEWGGSGTTVGGTGTEHRERRKQYGENCHRIGNGKLCGPALL